MVCTLLVGYLAILFVANSSPAERWLAAGLERTLSEKLHTRVSIDRLEIGLFNRITLRDVAIFDQQQKPLLTASLVSAKIEYRALLHSRVSLRSVSLLDADIRLYREHADSAANFQFILDALKSKDNDKPSSLDLTLNSVIIRRCRMSYDELYTVRQPHRLDLSHIGIKQLNASISLKRLTPDSLNLRVRSLAMREQSGLEIKDLSFRLMGNRKHCIVSKFSLSLPNSHFNEDRLAAYYKIEKGTPFFNTLTIKGRIDRAKIALADISPLVPTLRSINGNFECSTDFSVRPNAIVVDNLTLCETTGLLALRAHGSLLRRNGKIVRLKGLVDELQMQQGATRTLLSASETLTNKAKSDSVLTFIDRLGDVNLKGQTLIDIGGINHATAELSSDIGDIYASLHWRDNAYMLQTSSPRLDLTRLLASENVPTNVAFHADVKANRRGQAFKQFAANALFEQFDYKGHAYSDVALNLSWNGQQIQAHVDSSDPAANMTANASGAFDGKHLRTLSLTADASSISLPTLGVTSPLGAATISGHAEANFSSLNVNQPIGELTISNFNKTDYREADSHYHLDHLHLTFAPTTARGTTVHLSSDFAEANFYGCLSLPALKHAIDNQLCSVFPATFSHRTAPSDNADNLAFNVRLLKSDVFTNLLGIPLTFSEDNRVFASGRLSSDGRRSSIVASAPTLSYGNTDLYNLRLYVNGEDGRFSALVQGAKDFDDTRIKFALNAAAQNDVVESEVAWDDGLSHRYAGEVKAVTNLSRTTTGSTRFDTRVVPSSLTIRDTLWTLGAGRIVATGSTLAVDRLQLSHADQSVTISGDLNHQASDSLKVELRKVDVSYILSLIDLKPVSFAGPATGNITVFPSSDKGHLELKSSLRIPNFHFNDGLMGDADIKGHFSTVDKRLHLHADIQEEGVGYTLVNGYVGIGEKGLDLDIQSRNTTLYFLNRYVPDIFTTITGRTTGRCHIFGPFKLLDFEGEEQANVFMGISSTGCSYHLANGRVLITPGSFRFVDYDIADDNGGNGRANGELRHDHLKNIRYDFEAQAQSLALYDKSRSPDMPFYATACGTGTIRLYGSHGHFTADINVQPTRGTLFTYIVDNPESSHDVSLLNFGSKEQTDSLTSAASDDLATHTAKASAEAQEEEESSTTDIRLNFIIDMKPEGQLRIFTDEKAGNYMLLAGNGTLRATYYNKGAFQMYGTYTVDNGIFKMIIQEVIHKDFHFEKGGTIVFAGNPYEADLNLQAVYTVPSVSLTDLGLNMSDNSVRADCILNLGGKAQAPQVTFGLNLPDVSDEVRQMVHQLVTTEEDMNRQVLYLLGVGRFYNYNFAATDAALEGQSQSSVAMKSFLSSTLTGQLNNIISSAMGTSDWTFGTNISTGQVGWSDMEVAGLLSGRLFSGRLLVNGNFGYRERTTSTNNFIGDFDISYLLTPSGNVSLKAYSETNDRYFTKSSLTTQGIGVLLRRDFGTLRELFTPTYRKKRTTAATTDSIAKK